MIGTVLSGRYELSGLMDQGPIFSRYFGRDRLSGKEVTIRTLKQPFATEEPFLTALATSIAKVSTVNSPLVERLYELDTDEAAAYVVGDLTRAPLLSERIRKLAPFSSPVAVALAISLTRGLDALHRAGIVHGDLSSDHVALMADGEVRLLEAGIWEAYASSPTAGAVVLPGMAAALAPEVSSGKMPSARSDIYSVGILLFELLTGRKPYQGETTVATAMKHSGDPTPSVRAQNPSVPMVFDEIVKQAMAKDPAERYQNAGELLSDLRILQDALRFGKSLTWPITRAGAEAVAVKPVKNAAASSARVAPRMSAIRTEAQAQETMRRAREDRDVPVWMVMIIVFLFAMVLSLLGFWFVLNMNRPKMVSVPKLNGLTISEARTTLSNLHLELKVGDRVPNDRLEPDRVLNLNPAPGSKVAEHGAVTVTLSAGSRHSDVPELKGLTPDKAKSVLEKVNLSLDPNIEKVNNPAVPIGTIASQTPAAKTRVDRSTSVKVGVSAADVAPKPVAKNQVYEYTLDLVLSDVKDPVDVKIVMEDAEGKRTIYDDRHEPYDEFSATAQGKGDHATFFIYYGNRLVKQMTKQATEAGTP